MVTDNSQSVFNLANWTKLAKVGSTTAVSGLSQMVNKEFSITTLSIEEVSMRNATSLIGKAEDMVIGVYLLFTGNANGQILLAFHFLFDLFRLSFYFNPCLNNLVPNYLYMTYLNFLMQNLFQVQPHFYNYH